MEDAAMMSAGPRWQRAFLSGAGSGIGLGLAKELAARGVELAIFDLRISEAARSEIEAARRSPTQRVHFCAVDVTDPALLREAVDEAVRALGPPHLAIHSAGINIAKMFHLLSDEEYRRVVDVNLLGSRNFALAVLRSMSAGSHLVLVSSFAGLTPNWSYAAYSASKFGVVGLAGVLRLECSARGIGVSVVCPPSVPTPMVDEEEKGMHPVQRALKHMTGTVTVERAVRMILEGARRRKFLVLLGIKAKLTYLLLKLAPLWFVHLIADRVVRRVLRDHPEAAPDWSGMLPPKRD
jgi:NAD(P)-dependent dehydrogenase (short-subunit alcohol dehydrogenase family)